jgi:hypothetical protein
MQKFGEALCDPPMLKLLPMEYHALEWLRLSHGHEITQSDLQHEHRGWMWRKASVGGALFH